MSLSVLIIDHSAEDRDLLSRLFETRGDTVRTAESASEARIALAEHMPDVVILSLPLPDALYTDLATALLEDDPGLGLILLVGRGEMSAAAPAIARGAVCLERPAEHSVVVAVAQNAAERGRTRSELALRRADERNAQPEFPLAPGLAMLVDLASRHADEPVLIIGETGTEKGLLGRLIHESSSRAGGPFLEARCTTTAQRSLERRLFGTERGAAAESKRASQGLLELASDGTLLLSAITSLPFETQALMLRFVENGTFCRMGGSTELRSGARVMATATRPLAAAIDAGLFRADLFYRMQVLTIAIPPVRERSDEMESLVAPLLPSGASISPAAILTLQQHSWPGNMRELRNVIWRAAVLAGRDRIEAHHLPLTASLESGGIDRGDGSGRRASLRLSELQKRTILAALERTGGNKLKAAALLGIARSTLHEKLRRL